MSFLMMRGAIDISLFRSESQDTSRASHVQVIYTVSPIPLLDLIIHINAHSLLPEGYFLRMVRKSCVDDLIQFLDYRVSLQHEPADTRILIDLNCFALRERVRLSHEPGCLSLR